MSGPLIWYVIFPILFYVWLTSHLGTPNSNSGNPTGDSIFRYQAAHTPSEASCQGIWDGCCASTSYFGSSCRTSSHCTFRRSCRSFIAWTHDAQYASDSSSGCSASGPFQHIQLSSFTHTRCPTSNSDCHSSPYCFTSSYITWSKAGASSSDTRWVLRLLLNFLSRSRVLRQAQVLPRWCFRKVGSRGLARRGRFFQACMVSHVGGSSYIHAWCQARYMAGSIVHSYSFNVLLCNLQS